MSSLDQNKCTRRFKGTVVCGFKLMFEVGLPDAMPSLESTIKTDLQIAEGLLPPRIKSQLQSTTSIYVHLQKPHDKAVSRYHSRDCSSKLFAGNITISAAPYQQNRCCWGDGAVLAHEFAHAVHDKLTLGGYACETIAKAFKEAMETGRYQRVWMHHTDGTKYEAEAQACTNHKEFFAELSTAYLYSADPETEFNRTYPFNRAQLLNHDPASYSAIHSVWDSN